jgi:hypothetical protein
MANSIKGEVAVTAHGQLYTLVMTTNAMVELQGVFSTPEKRVTWAEVLKRLGENDVEYLRAFVWAAARRHHPEMTILDAGDFIDGAGGLAGIAKQIGQVAAAMRPDPEDVPTAGEKADDGRPTGPQAAPRSGPGGRSIGSRVKSA